MTTILETRGMNKTLRLILAGNGQWVVEDWNLRQQIWEPLFANEDFQASLHVYIDEVCSRANLQMNLLKNK